MTTKKIFKYILGAITIPIGLVIGFIVGLIGVVYATFNVSYRIFDRITSERHNKVSPKIVIIRVKPLPNGNFLIEEGDQSRELSVTEFDEWLAQKRKEGMRIYGDQENNISKEK